MEKFEVLMKYMQQIIIFNISYIMLTTKIIVGLVSPTNKGSTFSDPFDILNLLDYYEHRFLEF